MKTTNGAILALIASRQYYRAEIFQFTLQGGAVYYWTSYGQPLTVGGNLYNTGLVIKRGSFTQEVGITVPTLEMTLAPKWDSPNVPTIGGGSLLQAVRNGLFRNADFIFSRVFMGSPLDTSLGAVPFFPGRVSTWKVGRMAALLTIEAYTAILNQQMPRNLFQAGCVHTLYDAGCTLAKATFRVSGSVATAPSGNSITSGLTQADGYFALGVLTFTSGANNGLSYAVQAYAHASGTVTTVKPFQSAPAPGDTFTILPGCDKQQATCSAKFSNTAHYRGYRFVPTPETLYDGGTYNPPAPARGGQAGNVAGSTTGGGYGRPYSP